MQVAAALLYDDLRQPTLAAMGTFGADLFAQPETRFVWEAVAIDNLKDPVSIIEKPNAPENFVRFMSQALDVLGQWEKAGKKRR